MLTLAFGSLPHKETSVALVLVLLSWRCNNNTFPLLYLNEVVCLDIYSGKQCRTYIPHPPPFFNGHQAWMVPLHECIYGEVYSRRSEDVDVWDLLNSCGKQRKLKGKWCSWKYSHTESHRTTVSHHHWEINLNCVDPFFKNSCLLLVVILPVQIKLE